MIKKSPTNPSLLDSIACTFVLELEQVGIYHFNKLVYLFEYLYIKNFGSRYTKESFIKLPHGPVITNYKKRISQLYNQGYIDTDIEKLNSYRKVDDDFKERVIIASNIKTQELVIEDSIALMLTKKIAKQYGQLDIPELEALVYTTTPVVNYLSKVDAGFKNATGGYVLKDCVRFSDYKSPKIVGRKKAIEHLKNHPKVRSDQYSKLVDELNILNKFRPAWEA